MYTLTCKDMGVGTCDYVAKGKTKEEVIRMLEEHAMKEHPKEIKDMMAQNTKEEVEDMMADKIKEEM